MHLQEEPKAGRKKKMKQVLFCIADKKGLNEFFKKNAQIWKAYNRSNFIEATLFISHKPLHDSSLQSWAWEHATGLTSINIFFITKSTFLYPFEGTYANFTIWKARFDYHCLKILGIIPFNCYYTSESDPKKLLMSLNLS